MTMMEALEKSGVNVVETLRRFGENVGLLERFIRKFPQDETFGKLEAAIQQQNYHEAELLAHTLKGTSANLGFQELSRRCADMVAALRGGRVAEMEFLFPAVSDEHQKIVGLLQEIELEKR